MLSKLLPLLALAFILAFITGAGTAAPGGKASLQGVWVAKSLEIDGKPHSAVKVKQMRMQYMFEADRLLINVEPYFDGLMNEPGRTDPLLRTDPLPPYLDELVTFRRFISKRIYGCRRI